MAEELISHLGYGTPQSDMKCQKLLECVLTGNSKLYLSKVYTEEKIKELNPISPGGGQILLPPGRLYLITPKQHKISK